MSETKDTLDGLRVGCLAINKATMFDANGKLIESWSVYDTGWAGSDIDCSREELVAFCRAVVRIADEDTEG